MSQINLTAIAVAYLSTDTSAQRLIASWPLVAAEMAEDPQCDRGALWSEIAGVPLVVGQKLGAVLLRHGLVREDGTVAPEAAAVVNALASRKLKELRK